MYKKPRYELVEAGTTEALSEAVKSRLAEGWLVCGPIAAMADREGDYVSGMRFRQLMSNWSEEVELDCGAGTPNILFRNK